jgi:hypothetical protein
VRFQRRRSWARRVHHQRSYIRKVYFRKFTFLKPKKTTGLVYKTASGFFCFLGHVVQLEAERL